MNHGDPDQVGQEFKGTGNHEEADKSPQVPEELAWGRGWLVIGLQHRCCVSQD